MVPSPREKNVRNSKELHSCAVLQSVQNLYFCYNSTVRNKQKILVLKLNESDHLKDLGINGR
jgi:hypothetical protein